MECYQRILLRRIAYVDELSSQSAQVLSSAFNQAQIASDRVSEGKKKRAGNDVRLQTTHFQL